MTHNERLHHLESLGWHQNVDGGGNEMFGELCACIEGKISGVDWSGWIGKTTGIVYMHGHPPIDLAFEAFCKTVRDGWPKAKADSQRGLFGDDF